MYTQFFGNFLLSKSAVPADKLVDALERQSSSYLKLGTLAIHAGLLNASQVDAIICRQTHEDKKFGEIAIEGGILQRNRLTNYSPRRNQTTCF